MLLRCTGLTAGDASMVYCIFNCCDLFLIGMYESIGKIRELPCVVVQHDSTDRSIPRQEFMARNGKTEWLDVTTGERMANSGYPFLIFCQPTRKLAYDIRV